MKFEEWLDIFMDEKEINLEDHFEVTSKSGTPNIIPYGVVIEHIKIAPKHEQDKIKNILVEIDFKNGDVRHFLRHLGQAIAK